MRGKGSSLASFWLILTGFLLFLFAPLAFADTFYQLNVIVNQLDGATLPDLKQRQKAINEIFKQCDTHLADKKAKIRITISQVKRNRNPKKDGTPIAPNGDASQFDPGRKGLYELGNQEVSKGGYKVWVAKQHESNTNGSTLLGEPVSIIKQQSGIHGDAQTWAHEIGHGLGLEGDGKTEASKDPNNLMYGDRLRPDGKPAGTRLTKGQCEKMLKGIKKLKPKTAKTKAQQGEQVSKSSKTTLFDEVPDPVGVPGTPQDLGGVTVAFFDDPLDPSGSFLSLDVELGFVQTLSVTTEAFVLKGFFDLDGDPTNGLSGFDVAVELTPSDLLLIPVDMGTGDLLLPLSRSFPSIVNPLDEILDGPTDNRRIPRGTRLLGEIPLSDLKGLLGGRDFAPEIPAVFVLLDPVTGEPADFIQGTVDGPQDPGPQARLDPDEISPGDPLEVSGTGLMPLTPFEVLIDDLPVGTGTADAQGNFRVSVETDMLPPGDLLVDVIDSEGNVVLGTLKVSPRDQDQVSDLVPLRSFARCIPRPRSLGPGLAIAVTVLRNERDGATGDVTITDVQPTAGSDWGDFRPLVGPGRTLRDGGVAVVVARGTCTGDNLALDITFDDGTMFTVGPGGPQGQIAPQGLTVLAARGLLQVRAGVRSGVRSVEARVYDLAGRKVFEARAAGGQLLALLRDERGRPLANGVYLVEVKVERPDGIIVRELRKIALVR